MIGKTLVPSPKLILYMFKNIILPAMTYASFIWSHSIEPNSSVMKIFRRITRLALRMVGPSHKSTPTSGQQAILGIEDFDILTDRLGMQTTMRIGPPDSEWNGNLLLANGRRNHNRKGYCRHWMDKIDKTIPHALSGPEKPKNATCIPHLNWNKKITLKSPDNMNHTGTSGILNPYHNGSQYRMNILSMNRDQAATTRSESQSNPDRIYGNSCAGYKVLLNNKNKGLEEQHIETKAIIFKNETGKDNMRFLTAIKAMETINEITKNEEDEHFETIIFADFNRFAIIDTMINNMTKRDLLIELEKTKKTIILQPQKCKARKELANEVKQILNLQLSTRLEVWDRNHDIINI